jgi:hypothetical protein
MSSDEPLDEASTLAARETPKAEKGIKKILINGRQQPGDDFESTILAFDTAKSTQQSDEAGAAEPSPSSAELQEASPRRSIKFRGSTERSQQKSAARTSTPSLDLENYAQQGGDRSATDDNNEGGGGIQRSDVSNASISSTAAAVMDLSAKLGIAVEEIANLRTVFQMFDEDENGSIDLDEMINVLKYANLHG